MHSLHSFIHPQRVPLHPVSTRLSRSLTFGLALAGVTALGLSGLRPASAQELTFQLSNVTFADGATATGSFNFDLSTQTFGDYDFTTTNGTSDGLIGTSYMQGVGTNSYSNVSIPGYDGTRFSLYSNADPDNSIVFYTSSVVTGSGTYALAPGYAGADTHTLTYSGEFTSTTSNISADTARGIITGSLIITPAAVPEASTTVSFGLLLALGLGGAVIAAKRKKADAAA